MWSHFHYSWYIQFMAHVNRKLSHYIVLFVSLQYSKGGASWCGRCTFKVGVTAVPRFWPVCQTLEAGKALLKSHVDINTYDNRTAMLTLHGWWPICVKCEPWNWNKVMGGMLCCCAITCLPKPSTLLQRNLIISLMLGSKVSICIISETALCYLKLRSKWRKTAL